MNCEHGLDQCGVCHDKNGEPWKDAERPSDAPCSTPGAATEHDIHQDTERLNWLIFAGAHICHANDDEFCWLQWSNRGGDYQTGRYDNARDAIDAAIRGEHFER